MYSSVVTDLDDLPERLRNVQRDDRHQARVNWLKMIVSLHGGRGRAIESAFRKAPDLLLEAVFQEDLRSTAEIAYLYEGDDLAAIVKKVLDAPAIFSWLNLAKARPELGQMIQDKVVELWKKGQAVRDPRGLDVHYLARFLEEVRDTNPLPVLQQIVEVDAGRVVDLAIRMPDRISTFTALSLIMLRAPDRQIGEHVARFCNSRPGSASVLEQCIFTLNCISTRVIQICSCEIPGLDLDKIEEWCIVNWNRTLRQHFCDAIKRERGPLRDFLMVERIMEL